MGQSPTQSVRETTEVLEPTAESRLGLLWGAPGEPRKALSGAEGDDSREALIDALLNDQTYHIEFNGGLSNHDKHAVIALAGLGASRERIQSYYDAYAIKTPYGYPLEPPKASQQVITEQNWQHYIGKRTSFSAYFEFFDRREKELGMRELLGRYAPAVLPGWVGALTHATIHLGWALDVGHRGMIIEGLAYMAFSYLSCNPERTLPPAPDAAADKSALQSLLRIALTRKEDVFAIRDWVKTLDGMEKYSAKAGFHPQLARTELQHRIARLLAEGHPSIDTTPAWIDAQDMATIWRHLYYAMTLLYLSLPGDFVVLHLITASYGLEQIVNRLPLEEQKRAIKFFWRGMAAILLAHGEVPTRADLQALDEKYKDAVDRDGNPPEGSDWDEIIAHAITEEEEHNPKLVYVQQRLWRRYDHASVFRIAAACFTKTPQLEKVFEQPSTE